MLRHLPDAHGFQASGTATPARVRFWFQESQQRLNNLSDRHDSHVSADRPCHREQAMLSEPYP